MNLAKNNSSNKLTRVMKVVALICSLLMLVVLFVPIWQIQLTAPQYPEGLILKICANKLAGNVDIVNGLNHYIGMRMLHAEDFVEFTILPYIIVGYAALGLLTLVLNRKKIFNAWFILFIFIGIVSMIDFYRWEYNYGHELNPDAPIKVPGMTYQPPFIGYKQLLNFSAYSIPDVGGWIFAAIGLILVVTCFSNWIKQKSISRIESPYFLTKLAVIFLIFLASCSREPQSISYGKDNCDFCKMTIMDEKFAAQCISTKGKTFRFDDIHCLVSFLKNGGVWRNEIDGIYISDYLKNNNWIKSDKAFFLKSENFHGPMGGNIVAFISDTQRMEFNKQIKGEPLTWKDIIPLK